MFTITMWRASSTWEYLETDVDGEKLNDHWTPCSPKTCTYMDELTGYESVGKMVWFILDLHIQKKYRVTAYNGSRYVLYRTDRTQHGEMNVF